MPETSTQETSLAGLITPYTRGDLQLIRQAASNAWPTDTATKRLVVDCVIETRDDPASSLRTRRAAIRTLALLEAAGWVL